MWKLLIFSCFLTCQTEQTASSNEQLRQIVREFQQLVSNRPSKSVFPTFPTALDNLKSMLTDSQRHDHDVKSKLFNMLTDSKNNIDKRNDLTDNVQSYLTNDPVYKLGFMMGHLKSQYDLLKDVYEAPRNNLYEWDNFKVLDAYEQMHKRKQQLHEILSTLKTAMTMPVPLKMMTKADEEGKRIAWDYYDEN